MYAQKNSRKSQSGDLPSLGEEERFPDVDLGEVLPKKHQIDELCLTQYRSDPRFTCSISTVAYIGNVGMQMNLTGCK